jgi:CheY-like chemotaxis protein
MPSRVISHGCTLSECGWQILSLMISGSCAGSCLEHQLAYGNMPDGPGFMTTNLSTSARILLVEDHDDTARVLARLLHLSGYCVHVAGTYAGALDICGKQQFDLLISDVGLPDGSGYDLMREIHARRCAAKGIAVSGYGTEDDVEQSLRAGFAEHLVKPVAFDTLRDAIRRLIPE